MLALRYGLLIPIILLIHSTAYAELLCNVIANAATGKVLQQEGTACARRITPASTFKIALSLMGYDSGYLIDEHTPALPFRTGYPDWIESWKATTDPTDWMKNSVIWYSQQITRELGAARFKRYVSDFHYGNADVSGNPGKNDGLTNAWLTSSLKISPLEQIQFLRQIARRELPISTHAYDMTSRITKVAELPGGWHVNGKAGTGSRVRPDNSLDRTRQVGCFVGWATRSDRKISFVRCMEDEARPPPDHLGPRVKEEFLRQLPKMLSFL